MKVSGNGQAKILTPEEIRRLFDEGFVSPRDRALFGVCLFSACRISEALSLTTADIKGDNIIFRKATTKGKLKTRTLAIAPVLATLLKEYQPPRPGPLFTNRQGVPLTRFGADKNFKAACVRVNIAGASTHSLRRTALTQMSNANVPLRVIQEISGHSSLATLQLYLEVTDEQKHGAILSLKF